jgi:hypothetical protein
MLAEAGITEMASGTLSTWVSAPLMVDSTWTVPLRPGLVSTMARMNGMRAPIGPAASTAAPCPVGLRNAPMVAVASRRQIATITAKPQIIASCLQIIATPLRMALSVVRSALTE